MGKKENPTSGEATCITTPLAISLLAVPNNGEEYVGISTLAQHTHQ